MNVLASVWTFTLIWHLLLVFLCTRRAILYDLSDSESVVKCFAMFEVNDFMCLCSCVHT